MIDVISETDHFLIVRCLFRGEKHLTIWDKRLGNNVVSLPMRYKGSFAEQFYICPFGIGCPVERGWWSICSVSARTVSLRGLCQNMRLSYFLLLFGMGILKMIVAIGNPIHNERVKSLYEDYLTGEKEPEPLGVTSVSVSPVKISLGQLNRVRGSVSE